MVASDVGALSNPSPGKKQVEQDLVVAMAHCLSAGPNAALLPAVLPRLLGPLDASLDALLSLYQAAGASPPRHSPSTPGCMLTT